jgi:hypothetical protein
VQEAAAPAPVALPELPEFAGLLMQLERLRHLVGELRFERVEGRLPFMAAEMLLTHFSWTNRDFRTKQLNMAVLFGNAADIRLTQSGVEPGQQGFKLSS